MRLSPHLTAVLLLLLATRMLHGQEIRAGVTYAWPDHDLLGHPVGAAVAAGIRVNRVVGLRLGYERARDRFESYGSTCVGLIPPEQAEDCADEARRESSTLGAMFLAVPLVLHSANRWEAGVIPGLRLAQLESDQTGVESGRTRSARKTMSGLFLGAEVRLRPVATKGLWVYVSLQRTVLRWYEDERKIDGYSPFEEDVNVTHAEVGLSVRR